MIVSRQKTMLFPVFIGICVCAGSSLSFRDFNSTLRQSYDASRRLRREVELTWEPSLQDYVDKVKEDYDETLGRNDRNLQSEYKHLCQLVKKRIDLRDSKYEYRPPFYHEVWCRDYIRMGRFDVEAAMEHKQMCVNPGFICIQRTRTIYLSRRKVGHPKHCWEVIPKVIPSACECMWPVAQLGHLDYDLYEQTL